MKERTLKHRVEMSDTAYKLLVALFAHWQENRFKDRRRYRPERIDRRLITYGALRDRSGISTAPIRMGFYLGEVATFCLANDLPPLNALVVNGKTRQPGDKYLGTEESMKWARDVYACLISVYPSNLVSYVKVLDKKAA